MTRRHLFIILGGDIILCLISKGKPTEGKQNETELLSFATLIPQLKEIQEIQNRCMLF